MSISSILAFVLAGVAAKAKSVQVARPSKVAELWAEHLHAENVELKRRVAELEDAIATANVQARRDQELIDIWRECALGGGAQRPAGPDFRPPQIAQQQAAMMQAALAQAQHGQQLAQYNQQAAMMQAALAQAQHGQQLAQYNQQAAMNAQNFYNHQGAQYQNQMLGQAVGLLGAQTLIDAELWCNCVPARHDMFLRGR